jgi:spore maturation protein CgeB
MNHPLTLVVIGLSLSSSWGNGHAVTYRALLKSLAGRRHRVLFLERDVPWYAAHRDLPNPDYCHLSFYRDAAQLQDWTAAVAEADAVIVGSYVPDGIAIGNWVLETARGPVAFYDIDTPVTLAALQRGENTYLAMDQIARYDVYFSFTGGPILDRLERHYGSPAARALYCSVDPAVYHPVDVLPKWDLSYLGTYSDDRQPVLDQLLLEAARRAPERRFAVAGPLYPDGIAWPENVERLQHVPPSGHPAFYGASRFTLNITRSDMVAAGFSPSIRLFEAAACATPILSDIWDGIDTILQPGTEITLVRNADDVLAAMQLHEDTRSQMGRQARAAVLERHDASHRAMTLERELRLAVARKSVKPAQPMLADSFS